MCCHSNRSTLRNNVRVLHKQLFPSRPKVGTRQAPQQRCLSRVLRTQSANQIKDPNHTLMVLTRSSKSSDDRLACYWLHTTSLTVSCCTVKISSCLWGIHQTSYNCRGNYSSVTFRSPLELYQSSSADYSAPLMRFFFPTAQNNSSPLTSGLPHPICSTYRFSQPLSGLLLESFWSLISCF
jgi:hypothetical protein